MSSKYDLHNMYNSPVSTSVLIRAWKLDPEPLRPITTRVNRYGLFAVMNVVASYISGCRDNCWEPSVNSSLQNNLGFLVPICCSIRAIFVGKGQSDLFTTVV